MNFVNRVYCPFFLLCALGAAAPFNVNTPVDRSAKNVSQSTLIIELKTKAVREWVLRFVGPQRFTNFEPFVKPDVADRFVIKYQLEKSADKARWELSGKLDHDGLRRWSRLLEAKSGSGVSQPRPALVLTSETEVFTWDKTRSEMAETRLTKIFRPYHSRPMLMEALEKSPPHPSNEIETLAERLKTKNLNACLWLHVKNCSDCPWGQIEAFYFTTNGSKQALAQTFRISGGDPATFSTLIDEKLGDWLQSGLENLIASGLLISTTLRLRITGIDSFAKFKKLGDLINDLDPITHVILKSIERETAEYEIGSTLNVNDLYQRLGTVMLGEFRLKLESSESDRINARLQ